jgi:excisionase family DNA binding protein
MNVVEVKADGQVIQWYKAKDIAKILDVNESTVYRWKKNGLPSHKFGAKVVRYDLKEVREWLQQNK